MIPTKKYSDVFHIEFHTPWLPALEDSVYAMILPIAAVELPSLLQPPGCQCEL